MSALWLCLVGQHPVFVLGDNFFYDGVRLTRYVCSNLSLVRRRVFICSVQGLIDRCYPASGFWGRSGKGTLFGKRAYGRCMFWKFFLFVEYLQEGVRTLLP